MKHNTKGIKQEHEIISGILPILEQIKEIKGVKRIIPARIYKTRGAIENRFIKLQRKTLTGLKLLAHSGKSVQEIFVICNSDIDMIKLSKLVKI